MPSGVYKRTEKHLQRLRGHTSWNKGRKETRLKVLQTLSESHKGQVSFMTGKKHSLKTREKMSESHKGVKLSKEAKEKLSKLYKGSKCRFWKGGIAKQNRTERMNVMSSIEYHLWREAVFARDNWTCKKTDQKGGELVAHHINNFSDFPEFRTSIENGVTLSKKSHIEFHKLYGRKNNTKEQLLEFIKGELDAIKFN